MKNILNRYSILLIMLLAICFFATAQTANQKPQTEDNLNKKDSKNRKQGMWFYRIPERFGDPGYMEFGNYRDDLKWGLWYKMNNNTQLLAIENFKEGQLDGQSQYYENGKLSIIGNYRGIYSKYAYDTFNVVQPETLMDTLVAVPSDRGFTKHGTWRYYDPATGHLVREEEYQVDILLKEKDFLIPEAAGKRATPLKLPHEGGPAKGWKTNAPRSKSTLIK